MNVKNRWLIGFAFLLIIYLLLQFLPYAYERKNSVFISKAQPLVIAHRGAKKLYPENTILAFEKSAAMGVNALELDIRMSRDHVLCTIHDEEIAHYTNHQGKVWEYSYAELSLFNFGYYFKDEQNHYPYRNVEDDRLSLANVEQLFKQYGKTLYFILEIKDDKNRGKQAAKQLYTLINKYQMQHRVCVASFDHEVMEYFNKINKSGIPTIMDHTLSKSFVIANYFGFNRFQRYQNNGLMLPLEASDIPLDDQYLIDKIHKQGLFVFYWTINTKKEMKQLIEKGVDGIITDRPDLLIELLNK